MFDFERVMAEKSDIDLLGVINEPEKYQAEAIIATSNEILRRNLSSAQMEQARGKYQKHASEIKTKQDEPLEGYLRILTFLFPVLFMVFISGYLKSEGYERKAKELVTWTFYGFGAYSILILLSVLS